MKKLLFVVCLGFVVSGFVFASAGMENYSTFGLSGTYSTEFFLGSDFVGHMGAMGLNFRIFNFYSDDATTGLFSDSNFLFPTYVSVSQGGVDSGNLANNYDFLLGVDGVLGPAFRSNTDMDDSVLLSGMGIHFREVGGVVNTEYYSIGEIHFNFGLAASVNYALFISDAFCFIGGFTGFYDVFNYSSVNVETAYGRTSASQTHAFDYGNFGVSVFLGMGVGISYNP